MRLLLNGKKIFAFPICIYILTNIKIFCKASNQDKMAFMKVYMRHDQKISDINKEEYQDEKVKIYAPSWVRHAIQTLNDKLNAPPSCSITLLDRSSSTKYYQLSSPLSLKDIVTLSRNEPSNVSGKIAFDLYEPLIKSYEVIYSLKDIVRQMIIVGLDETEAYGGYPDSCPQAQNVPVILIDMIGLQFQRNYNSGRLVLISNNLPKGILDDFIYEKIVGEKKISYEEALSDNTGRYIKHNNVIFDTKAYELFVANDLLLTCVALTKFTDQNVKLKFLKYGTGYFAGSFGRIVEKHIPHGVEIGLKRFFEDYSNNVITSLEFPFYKKDARIIELCRQYNVKCKFTTDDALKQNDNLLMATTNCADPHAMPGNEMGYSSVDACIAQNLKSKAFKFNPIINFKMGEECIDLDQTGNILDNDQNIQINNKDASTQADLSEKCEASSAKVAKDICKETKQPQTFSKI